MTKIKETKNYWVDENNNSWNKSIYNKNDAETLSATLVNCTSCRNCSGCSDCRYCIDCSDCMNCIGCRDCIDCSDCRKCSEYKVNPQRIVSGLMGSRQSTTTVYWVDDNIQVVTGRFNGDLKQLKEAVLKTHKHSEYYNQYMEFIRNVEKYMEMCND